MNGTSRLICDFHDIRRRARAVANGHSGVAMDPGGAAGKVTNRPQIERARIGRTIV